MAPDEEDFSGELGDPYGDYLASLGSRYTVTMETEEGIGEVSELLDRFGVLRQYAGIAIECAAKVSDGHGACLFCILVCDREVHAIMDYGAPLTRTAREVIPVVLLSLRRDWGRVLIRQETLRDKVAGLVKHAEMDFPGQPRFGRFHYVLASDETRLRGNLTRTLMDLIDEYRDVVIEAEGDRLLAGSERTFTPGEADDLIDFAIRFSREE